MTASPASFRTILADFGTFLRRPRVMEPSGLRSGEALKTWAALTALSIGVLFGILGPFVSLWQSQFGLSDPEAFGRFPKEWLLPTVVIAAPLLEELLFRGWHSGTRRALWLLACACVGIGGFLMASLPDQQMTGLVLFGGAVLAALVGAIALRRNTAPIGWFARGFPVIFYLAAALFALVHLGNYDKTSLVVVPLVLPQLWAGLVLGYIRQRVGLIGSILAHAASNGLVLAVAGLVTSG